jgi:mono/diheme cytochrome c family protein
MKTKTVRTVWLAGGLSLLTLTGCHRDMWTQPKLKAQGTSDFYALQDNYTDLTSGTGAHYGAASRQPVPNTIARGHLRLNEAFYTGKQNGQLMSALPKEVKLTKELLDRGEERFNIYCSPCHGHAGDGQGMIAQRGKWPKPVANLHQQRLVEMPIGYFYGVISNGFGIMYSYASRIKPEDRWAIAAYVKVLQMSQNADARELSMKEIEMLNNPELQKQHGSGGEH